ncbi:hypothetical protein STEG23_023914 [Scotinomys teguina]
MKEAIVTYGIHTTYVKQMLNSWSTSNRIIPDDWHQLTSAVLEYSQQLTVEKLAQRRGKKFRATSYTKLSCACSPSPRYPSDDIHETRRGSGDTQNRVPAGMHMPQCVHGNQRIIYEGHFSPCEFHHVDSGNQTQIIRLGGSLKQIKCTEVHNGQRSHSHDLCKVSLQILP